VPGRRETTTITTRYLAALGVSLGCHATLLLALALLPPYRPSLRERPIVVAVLGDAGAAGVGTAVGASTADGDEPASSGAEAAPVAAPPEPRVADASVAPAVNAPQVPTRRERARHAAIVASRASARRDAAAPSTDTGATAPADEDTVSGGRGRSAGDDAGGSGRGDGAGVRGMGRGAGSVGAGGGGDLRASCAICPTPEYPARARRQGWQGTVDVELCVDRDGAVAEASIGRSSGFAVLDAAAVTVARRSRFRVAEGAELHGQLRYRFILDEARDRPL
jgi:protein TonB